MSNKKLIEAINRLNDNIERMMMANDREYPSGSRHYASKIANIYHKSGSIIAKGVCLSEWARANGYCRSQLGKTACSNKSKPHNWRYNPHYYREIYAEYLK